MSADMCKWNHGRRLTFVFHTVPLPYSSEPLHRQVMILMYQYIYDIYYIYILYIIYYIYYILYIYHIFINQAHKLAVWPFCVVPTHVQHLGTLYHCVTGLEPKEGSGLVMSGRWIQAYIYVYIIYNIYIYTYCIRRSRQKQLVIRYCDI